MIAGIDARPVFRCRGGCPTLCLSLKLVSTEVKETSFPHLFCPEAAPGQDASTSPFRRLDAIRIAISNYDEVSFGSCGPVPDHFNGAWRFLNSSESESNKRPESSKATDIRLIDPGWWPTKGN